MEFHHYATPGGRISLEWEGTDPKYTASLIIEPDTHTGDWQWLNIPTGDTVDRELDLNNHESWQWLAEQIECMLS